MITITLKRPSIKWGLLLPLFLIHLSLFAQNDDVRGVVADTLGNPISKTTVTFIPKDFGRMKRSMTDSNGEFSINPNGSKNYSLIFSMIGHKPDTLRSNQIKSYNKIVLYEITYNIEEVTVISHPKIPILASRDTISYNLASFSGKDDKYLYQTLGRIKGIRISEDGNIIAHGQRISKIMLNDEEIFNGNVGLLTRNLPLDVLETAEVINDYGRDATITGIKGKSNKILNIHTKSSKAGGTFAEVHAGAGSRETYNANGTLNFFDEKSQLSASAGTNNINRGNLLGSSNLDNSASSPVGIEGLNRATNIAVNGRQKINPENTIYVTADQSISNNATFGKSENTTILGGSDLEYGEDFSRNARNISRQASARYDLNRNQFSLNVSPKYSYQQNESADKRSAIFYNSSDSIREYSLVGRSNLQNFGSDISAVYKLGKANHTIGARLLIDNNQGNDDKSIFNSFNLDADPTSLQVSDSRRRNHLAPSIFYNLNIGRSAIVNLSYNRDQLKDDLERFSADQNGMTIDSLSGFFESEIVKNHFDARLQYRVSQFLFDVIASYQNDNIRAQDRTSNTSNDIGYNIIAPSLGISYFFNDHRDLTVNAKKYSTLPTANQVINIPSLTDPLFIYSGNLFLSPEEVTQFHLSYRSTNPFSGSVFRAGIEYMQVDNKIIASTQRTNTNRAQQSVSLINADGFKSFSADYLLSKNIDDTKILDLSGRVNLDNNPMLIEQNLNYGRSFNLNQTVRLIYNPVQSISLTPSVMYRMTDIKYGIESAEIPPISTFNLMFDGAVNTGKFIAKIGANQFINTGFSGQSFNNFIVNTSLGYTMLKGAWTVNLEVTDLLNNNTGIRRNITNNTISDLYVNRLSRYVMLSTVFKIGKFK